jgi:hypothetical protein
MHNIADIMYPSYTIAMSVEASSSITFYMLI